MSRRQSRFTFPIQSLIAAAAVAIATLAPLSGCSDSTAASSAKLSLLLTDAPGDVKKAVVTISEIYLQGSGGDASGRVVLRSTPITTDLLTLANSTAELVQDATVPAGTYSQLRFVVTGAFLEVENESGGTSIYASSPTYEGLPPGAQVDGALQMPSYAQSGIKVNLPGGAVSITGEQNVLLVDFDVARSFGHQAGDSESWVMTPVLQATDFSVSSSVAVTLQADASLTMPSLNGTVVTLADFKAVLSSEAGSHEQLALTDSDGDGVYEARFRYLTPGSYSLTLSAPAGVSFSTTPIVPASVSALSGLETSIALTLTSAVSATP